MIDSGQSRGLRMERTEDRPTLVPDIVQTTRGYLDLHLKPLREAAARGEAGVAHARRLASVFDGLLSAYFIAARTQATVEAGPLPEPLALLAVGGYGRGLLGLGSDLDLLVLAPSTDHPGVHTLAEMLLYPLWDAGVSIGHAVRTPEELLTLARSDLRTATMVLDARVVAGDRAFAEESVARGWRALFEGDINRFLDALSEEMAARHGRYGASVYLLEPDLKHGRGALRDLDIARWALRARYRAADLSDALKQGSISQHDADTLEGAREYFWRARGVLHARTGRRNDRLTFEDQEECGKAFGFVDPALAASDPLRASAGAAEQFMLGYYRHARAVATTVDRLLESCRVTRASHERVHRSERVAEGVERFEGTLTFADAEALRRDPALALRIVDLALHHGLPLAGRARDMIAQHALDAAWAEALRRAPSTPTLFLRLLTHSPRASLRARGAPVSAAEQGAASVLAELHDLGLLLAIVPEFGPVTGRIHHDVYHVYTVDVHSVAALDRLHQIARGELSELYALPTRVLADLERRDLVCLATLLHDVGKGRGGDHSAVGAELAARIARRLLLSSEDADEVAWLVREHLTLYHLATRRDLSDPATLAQVIGLVRDPWRLRALYLLTVADLSTTSPTSMTTWKARMLDDLLRRAEEAMGRERATPSLHVDELRRRAVAFAGREGPMVERFLAGMPERYVLATPPESIARHARAAAQVGPGRALVHLAPLEGEAPGDLAEVVIVAPDRPGLLARLSAMLYANRLDVQSAQLYSRVVGESIEAVDVFTVRRLDADPGGLARLAAKLPRDLSSVLSADELPDHWVASRTRGGIARPEPAVRTEVELDNHASDRYTVIELFGRDRPGLLYAVARAHYELGLSIALAKVNTEGRRVADVFYVTDTAGNKIPTERFAQVRARLSAALEGT